MLPPLLKINLRGELVTTWTNFARNGNPNSEGSNIWPKYTPEAQCYLAQSVPSLSTFSDRDFTDMHKCDFWKGILVYN